MLVLDGVLLLKKKKITGPSRLTDGCVLFLEPFVVVRAVSAARKTCVLFTEASAPRASIHYQRDCEPLFTWLPWCISAHVNQELLLPFCTASFFPGRTQVGPNQTGLVYWWGSVIKSNLKIELSKSGQVPAGKSKGPSHCLKTYEARWERWCCP